MIYAELKPNFDSALMTNDELLGILRSSALPLDTARSSEKWGIRGV